MDTASPRVVTDGRSRSQAIPSALIKRAGRSQERVNFAKQYVRDYLTLTDMERLSDLAPGDRGLAEIDGDKYAAFRAESGKWTGLSPVCTRDGCIVHWNGMEKSWDCPRHGSRFRCDGDVLEGPAIRVLEQKELREE